ncbi:retrovirus-related pol polyprotein from transposon TNT 1-94 [Tanacetum coccineum]
MHLIQSLASKELVRNLPKLKFDQHFCDAYKIGKQAHASHKGKNVVSMTRCLELLHMDLFGPSAVRSYGGNCYTLVIVDDYSREFDNEVQFGEFCNANRITHNFSAPRTPQSNGVVERKNRTLQEMSRTMLNEQSLPQKFWCNIIDTSTYILNRILIRAILGKAPYELLRDRKPTLDYFRVFGSKCFILNTKDYLTKFDPKSYKGIFLSYSQNSKAYIILNKHTRKVKESLNVTFDETPPPSKTSPLVDDNLDEEEEIRNYPLENVIGNLNQRTLRSQDQNQSNFFCFISTIEPKNVNEALTDDSWIVAMQEELNQFIANDVWELVPQPRNMTIIGTKWVFRNKLDKNSIVSQNKARILLAYACALDFKLFQMDVKSAFLNGFINEEEIMPQCQVCRIRHEEEIDVLEYQILTREIVPTLKPLEEIILENIFCLGGLGSTSIDNWIRNAKPTPLPSSTIDYRKALFPAIKWEQTLRTPQMRVKKCKSNFIAGKCRGQNKLMVEWSSTNGMRAAVDSCKAEYFTNFDDVNKVAIGYKNPLYLTRAKQVLPALYNGHVLVMSNHARPVVHDSEDTRDMTEMKNEKNDGENKKALYVIKNLEHQIQEKDNVIRDLKVLVSNVNDRSCEPYNAKDVTALIEQNECIRVELEKVKQHYKELYDSIKIMRVRTREKTSTMLNEIESLKAQLKSKVSCVTSDSVKPKVLAPGMYAIDVKPIPHPLKNNRSAHLTYINHLKESVETVREIVEEARVVKPLDNALNYACQYTKLSQELLEYVIGTCPKSFNERDNKAPSTPVTRKKQVTFNDKPGTSRSYRTVRFGNDHFGAIMGYGDYVIGDSVISRVYYVEGLGHNLFSVGQFCDSDLEVAFRKHSCFVRDINGADLLKGSRSTNLYTISIDDMMKSSPICLLSKASKSKSWLWHRRLNHLNFGTINDLAQKDLVRGLPRLKFEKDHLCSACQLGKSKKFSHKPKSENINMEVLHTLHMDLCGPMRVQSINGKKYILVIVDDYSRFTWVKFLRSKDETPEFVINFLKQIQVGLNKTVRYIRTDNGTEFVNQVMSKYYEGVGIFHQKSVPRTPQQNGVVERRNRTLVEAARTMLIFSKAPMFLWAEAVATACYTQNRSLIHTRHNKTPYELVHDKKPDLTFLRVFGALCYPTNDSEDLGKFQAKADIGIFVGYAPSRKGYRIYNKRTRRLMETIHVTFDEMHQTMAPVRISSGPEPIMMTPGQLNSGLAPSPVPATTYIPPTDKDLEILFQPMFDEYFDQSTDSEPVPTATV